MGYHADNRYHPIDPSYNSGYEDGRKASKEKIKDLEQANAEYRVTIAQQAELLAAHKAEMQDWQRELLKAQQQRDELLAEQASAVRYAQEAKEYMTTLERQRDELLAAVKTLKQAVVEMTHARRDPNWFTDGYEGATRHFFSWSQKGMDAANTIEAAMGENP